MAEEDIAGWSGPGSADSLAGKPGLRREEFHEGIDVAPVAAARRGSAEAPIRQLIGELSAAACSAAEALFDAHKRLAAEQMADIAGTVRRTGDTMDQTESRIIARYAERTASRIESAGATTRERRWGEIAAEIEAVARRQPTWFVLGALGAGIAIGRLLTAAAERERRRVPEMRLGTAHPPEVARVGEAF